MYVCLYNVGKLLKQKENIIVVCEYAHSTRLTKKLIMKKNDKAFCTIIH